MRDDRGVSEHRQTRLQKRVTVVLRHTLTTLDQGRTELQAGGHRFDPSLYETVSPELRTTTSGNGDEAGSVQTPGAERVAVHPPLALPRAAEGCWTPRWCATQPRVNTSASTTNKTSKPRLIEIPSMAVSPSTVPIRDRSEVRPPTVAVDLQRPHTASRFRRLPVSWQSQTRTPRDGVSRRRKRVTAWIPPVVRAPRWEKVGPLAAESRQCVVFVTYAALRQNREKRAEAPAEATGASVAHGEGGPSPSTAQMRSFHRLDGAKAESGEVVIKGMRDCSEGGNRATVGTPKLAMDLKQSRPSRETGEPSTQRRLAA